jgi:hypothetical protein
VARLSDELISALEKSEARQKPVASKKLMPPSHQPAIWCDIQSSKLTG